jgi:hypothetical protein
MARVTAPDRQSSKGVHALRQIGCSTGPVCSIPAGQQHSWRRRLRRGYRAITAMSARREIWHPPGTSSCALTHNCRQDRYNGSRGIMATSWSQPTVMSHVGPRWSLKPTRPCIRVVESSELPLSSPGPAWLATRRSRHHHEPCLTSQNCRTSCFAKTLELGTEVRRSTVKKPELDNCEEGFLSARLEATHTRPPVPD